MAAEQAPGASSYTGMPRRQPRLRQPHIPAPSRSRGTMKRPAACAAHDHASPKRKCARNVTPVLVVRDESESDENFNPRSSTHLRFPINLRRPTSSESSSDGRGSPHFLSDNGIDPDLLEELELQVRA